jgi:hypothetical protein
MSDPAQYPLPSSPAPEEHDKVSTPLQEGVATLHITDETHSPTPTPTPTIRIDEEASSDTIAVDTDFMYRHLLKVHPEIESIDWTDPEVAAFFSGDIGITSTVPGLSATLDEETGMSTIHHLDLPEWWSDDLKTKARAMYDGAMAEASREAAAETETENAEFGSEPM